MTPGRVVRALLGLRLSRVVGRRYRAAFVDLEQVARALATAIPLGAHVLDVGGGDGEPLNNLLALRPDITVATINLAESVGQWIEPKHSNRVACFPRTSVRDYIGGGHPPPNVVLVSDVLHHIPAGVRRGFVTDLVSAFDHASTATLIVKDVEPGYLRATLGYWSDLYVTGDKTVKLISRAEVTSLLREIDPGFACDETGLFVADAPNYVLLCVRPAAGSDSRGLGGVTNNARRRNRQDSHPDPRLTLR